MATTTRSDFHADTEALEVAAEFASRIRDKIVLVTGVNKDGIGFATAQAIVSIDPPKPYIHLLNMYRLPNPQHISSLQGAINQNLIHALPPSRRSIQPSATIPC